MLVIFIFIWDVMRKEVSKPILRLGQPDGRGETFWMFLFIYFASLFCKRRVF